jgi:hypothetical protein
MLRVGWHLPISAGCSPHNQTNQNSASEKPDQNSCTVLGPFIVSAVGEWWDFSYIYHIFDASLAVFTRFLACFTGFAWKITVGLLRYVPQVERAYIAGGVSKHMTTIRSPASDGIWSALHPNKAFTESD